MTAITPTLMTTEELLALPDDGTERWLIRGQLREKPPTHNNGKPMTVRNSDHSEIMALVTVVIGVWLKRQPVPRGKVVCGEAGFRLRRTPESTVGIDVAYVDAEVAARRSKETTLIDGTPVLAVEILSPSDTQEDINEKIDEYLDAGVKLVWIIDPHDRTVTIYRSGVAPVMVNDTQELSGEPDLAGFRVPVSELFP